MARSSPPDLLVRAPAEDLPALFDGRPVIVAESRLPDTVALHGTGARICRAHVSSEGVTLCLGPPREAGAAPVALDHPPPAVLALVAQTPLALDRLAEWWRQRGLEPPVVVTAESGLAALPGLMAVALGTAEAAARRACELEQRGAALREETERLRASVAAMLNTVAGRPPPSLETRLDLQPDPAAAPLCLAAGADPWLAEPGLPTAGVARLSLHIAGPATAALSIRLIGAESGRVLAAWRVPAAALPAGWLQLETPEPLHGRPESLLLGLRAEGEAGEVAVSVAAEAPGEPAIVIASLPPGARMVQPLHMDWSHWHGDAPAAVPRLAPAQMLAGTRLAGPGVFEPGTAGLRRLVLPEGWEAARLDLGPLPEGCAALRCDLRLDAGAAEARLVLEDGAAATDWRVLPVQEARPFALPIAGGTPAVALELRGAGATTVEILQPVLFPAVPAGEQAAAAEAPAEPAPARHLRAQPLHELEGPYPREAWPATAPADQEVRLDGEPHFAEVVLDARQRGPDWELLDLRLRGLALHGERWRELKFKFGLAGANVTLEFRRAPSWPRAFESWPGTEKDAYGEKFVLVLDGEELRGLDRVAPGRDASLVTALAAVMPRVVAEVLEEGDSDPCALAALRLAARMRADA